MTCKVRIVGLGGSMDGASISLGALRVALGAAERAGATVELLDLNVMRLPLFEYGLADAPDVRRFVETLYRADGHIWSSPLYHGTVSGAFKNAIDWLELLNKREPPYLTDKVVGCIGTAGGVQSTQVINTMEYIARSLRAWTTPLTVPVVNAYREFNNDGQPSSEDVVRRLEALGQEVARVAAIFARQRLTTPEAARSEDGNDRII